MQNTKFDVIVIGAGSGGLNVAGFCNRIGLSVLLVDKSDAHIGGDCLNYGCVPSKALIHVAREVRAARGVSAFGVTTSGDIDVQKVMQYVREKQEILRTHENADHFRKLGMTVVLGEAKFSGPRSVMVENVEYHTRHIVLATGSRPRHLSLPGLTVPVFTTETIFSIATLPKHFVFIGGGPISLELGQAFSYLGSKVTIVHTGERILEKEDTAVSAYMREQLERDGVRFVFKAESQHVQDGELVVKTPQGEERMTCDAVFVGIGRELNIEGLQLEKAGIALTSQGKKIEVNEYLQTTNPHVWTVGDVAGNYQFTHAAEEHAKVVIRNMFSPLKTKFQARMAWVTYTQPEVATFGTSRADLEKAQTAFEVISVPLSDDDRGIVDSAPGFVQLHVGNGGRILGGTLVAPHAGEMVGELVLADYKKLTTADIFARVSPYPTASRVLRKAAGIYEAKKLTPFVQKILRVLFMWYR